MDFLKYLPKLFNTVVSAEYITFVAALFLLSPKRIGIWRLFIPLLFICILAETTGWYQNYFLGINDNALVFNLNYILNTCFTLWMISTAAPLKRFAKRLRLSILLFLAFAFINMFFFQGTKGYDSSTEVFGDIMCIIASCIFFYSALSENEYRNLFRYEYFWFVNGVLFYSLGGFVLYLYYVYLKSMGTMSLGASLFKPVNNILNLLLYSSYIIAFICRNRNTK